MNDKMMDDSTCEEREMTQAEQDLQTLVVAVSRIRDDTQTISRVFPEETPPRRFGEKVVRGLTKALEEVDE